jgi:hypothetical protein
LRNGVEGIFGPKSDEVTREWEKRHNKKLCDLYVSPNIVRGIKLRRMRWVEHVVLMGEKRGLYRVLDGRKNVCSDFLFWFPNGSLFFSIKKKMLSCYGYVRFRHIQS